MRISLLPILKHRAAYRLPVRTAICLSGSLLLAAAAVTAHAVPADPRPKKVLQADGTWITVTMAGDENGSITLTEDGRAVSYNMSTGCFEDAGPTAVLPLPTSRRKAIKRSGGHDRIKLNDYPTTGVQRSLVLLVEFSNVKFTSVDNPRDFYDRMLNEEGFTHSNGANGSARDFYISSSAGLFRPEFTVVGPITLPQTAEYYGGDYPTRDANVAEVLRDACLAADGETDFSQFDTDGDGYVDNVFYFYAGYGQADNPTAVSTIWPHSANLEDAGIETVCDGVRINNYACSNELVFDGSGVPTPTGIGTFVHEFGHVLGLADHYDVYGTNTFTVGPWDTMATGSYNNNGHTPPLFSAFERAELGWLDYTELSAVTDTVSIMADLKESGRAYRVSVAGNDNEYYILENRQQTGWDAYLPGHGLLVWHIDMDEKAWSDNTVNTETGHQRVDIIAADGKRTDNTRGADTFPGDNNVTQATLTSWDGETLISFDEIAEQHATVKLACAGTACRIPQPAGIDITALADSSFTLTWDAVEAASRYLLTVTEAEADGSRTVVADFDGKTYTDVPVLRIGGLKPLTDYEISVVAAMGSYSSDALVKRVQTTEIPFEKLRPSNVIATETGTAALTAAWEPVRDADSYAVTLCRRSMSEPADQGYDFTGKADGLPALWSASSTTYYSVSGYYGEAAPSMRMSADGDYLEIAYPESLITGLSFWCRSRGSDGTVHIDRWTGDAWVTDASFAPPTEGGTQTFDIPDATKVRIRYERESSSVVIDDVTVSCRTLERTPLPGYDDLTVGNVLSYSFTGLEPATGYSLYVTALSDGRRSLPSEELYVTTAVSDGIRKVAATAGRSGADSYDLAGRRQANGGRSRGVIITEGGKKLVR